ncbi:MAG: 50S ribosomal protein L10 [Candidatus Magasanikbacteria bacterium GW2011_GWA2_46_17]|uniref:Large ribosomal subunit protein uL10 n=1 Tax=Candidatus Magasanikbacteria bacterium GW2011_GWA2_46_17 TaxID=1619042 RepID=A0A0G1P0A1_9BACT|nr:MAG: 50S ribosomal protein L10 [Candidatus Magasanikbacteria bacterium GW2011_GWA2_46_17]
MPKTKQQKQVTVQSITKGLREAKSVVFANFQGLKVSEAEELRKNARKENIEVLAAKKTLLKRAFDEAGLSGVDPSAFQGGIATFFGNDEVAPAKIVNSFAKTHDVVTIFGGVLEGKFIDAAGVKNLAALPGKTELLGRLVGTLQAPISGFVNALAGNIRNIVNVLNNIKEAKA